jgi:LacI family transcriptional regulator
MVIRDLTNPFYDQFVENVESVLKDYSVVYLNTRLNREREVKAIETLMAYRADGLIIAPVDLESSMDHLWKWVNSGKPIASLDRLPGIETNCVELDDYSIGYILSEHLLQNGHTRICFLSGSRPNDTRVMGFKTCLLDHGISLSESSVFPTEINLRSGYEVGLSVLKREGAHSLALAVSHGPRTGTA